MPTIAPYACVIGRSMNGLMGVHGSEPFLPEYHVRTLPQQGDNRQRWGNRNDWQRRRQHVRANAAAALDDGVLLTDDLKKCAHAIGFSAACSPAYVVTGDAGFKGPAHRRGSRRGGWVNRPARHATAEPALVRQILVPQPAPVVERSEPSAVGVWRRIDWDPMDR